MEEGRCGNNTSEDTLDGIDFKTGVKITERAVGENKTDVQPHERTAPPKNKTHESADAPVFFNPVAIVNPDERKILHIVKNFEQRDAGKNVDDTVIAIPPEADARDDQRQLHWIGTLSLRPHSREVDQEQNRNRDGGQ